MAINRDMADVVDIANKLFHPDGTQKKKTLPKSDARDGTTSHPEDDGWMGAQKNIPQVHAIINAAKHMQNLGHHLNAEVFDQGMSGGHNKTDDDKANVLIAKLVMHDEAKDGPLNLRFGEADGVNGGSTDTC